MKKSVVFAAVVAAFLLIADAAHARRWVYTSAGPVRLHPARRVVVAPVYPLWVPSTTTVVAPNVIIGPRGRVHYVTPYQPIYQPITSGVYIK